MGKPAPIIIPGTRYGHFELTGMYIPSSMEGKKQIRSQVECKCDCGSISTRSFTDVKKGQSKSCSKKCPYYVKVTHGLSMDENSRNTKEYNAWASMKRRCYDTKFHSYKNYGERGITVHHEWLESPVAFIEYIGKAPSHKHSIDRIDNSKGYEPGNVKWATPIEQANNRRPRRKNNNSNTEQANLLIKFG